MNQTIHVIIGKKCKICNQPADTIVISNLQACPSCVYTRLIGIQNEEVARRREERIAMVHTIIDKTMDVLKGIFALKGIRK